MKIFNKGEEAWCYEYGLGLFKCVISDPRLHFGHITVEKYEENILKQVVMPLQNVFKSKAEADAYSFVINYKRGWLRRELEKHPSDLYNKQMEVSMYYFPELWI